MQVSCQLKVLKIGVTDEFQVATRIPALVLTSSDTDELRSVLASNDIQVIKLGDCETWINICDAERAREILTDFEITQDSVDFELVERVNSLSADNQTVTEEDVIARVGVERWNKLRVYQKSDVLTIVNNKGGALYSEMGSGKTFVAILGIYYFIHDHLFPALVVCPSILRHTWRRELKQWIGEELEVFMLESSKQLLKPIPPHDVLLVSYGLVYKPQVLQFINRYKILICDESHNLQSRESERSKAVLEVSKAAEVRIVISGTPFSFPSQLYTQLQVLHPELYPVFFKASDPDESQYARRYCKPNKVRIAGIIKWEFLGYERQDELGAALCKFLVRHTKQEVLKQLPPKLRTNIVLPELTKQEYEDIELEKKKENKKFGAEQIQIKKFDYMESFRLTCSFKIPHVMDFLTKYIIDDLMVNQPETKCLIFAHHSAMIDATLELLTAKKISHCCIRGSTSKQKRAQYEDEFQAGKYQMMVLSIKAACAGLTLTAANVVIFEEILFTPAEHCQAEDRSHRIGAKRLVNIFYLITPASSDDINIQVIKRKEREMTNILDGAPREMKARRVGLDVVEEDTGFLASLKRKRNDPDISTQPIKKNRVVTKRMLEQKRES
jgi:SWI/SNF-related matrix-associated actin-dependent regulator 1 of chromatin subfamily A